MQTRVFKQDNKEVIQEGNHLFIRVREGSETFESGDFNTLESAKKSIGIKPTTEETNKLIAEFLGLQLEQDQERLYINGLGTKLINETFNKDWNWLMEAVENIESLEDTERFEITNSGVNITHYQTKEVKFIYNGYHTNKGMYLLTEKAVDTKIEAVYMAVVEFIKWYNKNAVKN